jgi:hypothetical protein
MFGRALKILVRAAWFRCKRPEGLFWAFFEIVPHYSSALAEAPRPPPLLEQGDRAE